MWQQQTNQLALGRNAGWQLETLRKEGGHGFVENEPFPGNLLEKWDINLLTSLLVLSLTVGKVSWSNSFMYFEQ